MYDVQIRVFNDMLNGLATFEPITERREKIKEQKKKLAKNRIDSVNRLISQNGTA
jgi:hypothetical protein